MTANGGVGPLTWGGDRTDVVLVLVLALGYAAGVVCVRRQGLRWPWHRVLAWVAGLAAVLGVTASGIDRDARVLMWVFALQLVALLMVAPVLLAYGRPVSLLADAFPHRRLVAGLVRGPVRLLATPLAGPLIVPAVLMLVYFTPVLGAVTVRPPAQHALQVVLVLLGLLLALGLVGDTGHVESSNALGAAVAIGVAELLLDAVPGIVIAFAKNRYAPAPWAGAATIGGLTPLNDQQRAGSVLWLAAELSDLPFLAILFRRWVRADELEARRLDAELDVREGAPRARPPAAPGGARAPGPVRPEPGDLQRPWWETDPARLGGHRVARQRRPGTETD